MAYWVTADTSKHKNALFGPYETYSRALSIKDGLDDGNATIESTDSYRRKKAVQEIRHRRAQGEGGVDEVYKNFSHRGELDE